MSISFQCPHCAKKLKAPENAAGKSSNCPRCGHLVTCPEPVYEAEVVVTRPGPARETEFDPYTDLDDGTPYAIADQSPTEQNSSTERRPCPMCGEMVMASALKCRFCGEAFETSVAKPKSKKTKKKMRKPVSSGGAKQGLGELLGGLACFGIGTALTVGGYMNAAANPNGGRYFIFYGLIIGGLVGMVRGVTNMTGSSQ